MQPGCFSQRSTNQRDREKEKLPKKTRDNTEWAMSVFKAWSQYRNNEILTLEEEYSNVPVNLETTSPREINYWLIRFILEVMKKAGTAYPANSLYLLACG